MSEDWAQGYDPKIHKEYVIHDTLFTIPHHL